MRVLALDHGRARIGAAVSDEGGMFAQPLESISGRADRRGTPLQRVVALVREYRVEQIVVGLPLHMNGQPGEQAQAARRFGEALRAQTGLPVDYLDERWTSREAERELSGLGLRGARRRSRVDGVAAAILLRTYLERERAPQGSGPCVC